ncbi:TPA: ead/Ea22-like family protein [Escherichia albertii]|nr:ead/Ea22-like family protein [Escherichia albertii]
MSEINYQALREAAEKATWGDWDSYKPHRGARGYEVRLSSQAIAQHVLKNNAEFIAAFNPKIALASLEAKPIGAFHIAEQQVDGTSDYIKDGEWPIDNGTIEVYAAPPAPVVPEEKPMPNPLSMYAVDAVAAIAEVRGWNACRAAMLQGKSEQPQNVQQNIPENIPGGNSPVTPDGWVMVPKELTPEMMRAVQIRSELGGYATSNLSGAYNMFSEFWNVAVSAAPKVDDL